MGIFDALAFLEKFKGAGIAAPSDPTPIRGGLGIYIYFKRTNLYSPKQEEERFLFLRFRFTNSKKIKFFSGARPPNLIFVCLLPLSVVPSLW